MIDSNEVRIGNLVNYNDGEYGFDDYVVIIEPHEIHTYRTIAERIKNAEFHPIPITPEWLERLGFEKNQYKYEKINLTETIYTIDVPNDYGGRIIGSDYNGEFKIRLEGCDEGKVGDFIKYIHQLQNLYHALTGQELTVKELTTTI